MAGEGARKADEERGVRRRGLSVLVLLVAVRIVDPDADDLFGIGDGDLVVHFVHAEILRITGDLLGKAHERAIGDDLAQCFPAIGDSSGTVDHSPIEKEAISSAALPRKADKSRVRHAKLLRRRRYGRRIELAWRTP